MSAAFGKWLEKNEDETTTGAHGDGLQDQNVSRRQRYLARKEY